MSSTANKLQPPKGEFFIDRDWLGDYHGWGQVLSCPGAGILFCAIRRYGGEKREMVPSEKSVYWQFFETLDECLAAIPDRSAA